MLTAPKWLLGAILSTAAATLLTAQTPAITTGGTVNAADYSRDFAPGTIISIFGSNLASATGGAVTVPLPTTLGGASIQVTSNGSTSSLPLFYVSPTQLNAQLPYTLTAGQSAQVRVVTSAGTSAADTINITARTPKLFTLNFSGKGSAVATDPNFNVLTASVPAKPADTITLWMTGLGATSPAVTAGTAAPGAGNTPPALVSGVTVKIDGKDAPVTFAGLAPGFAGLYQINVQAPFSILTGPVSVQVTAGAVNTQAAVTLPYRALGFYNALVGGKSVSTQSTVTGTAALAVRQDDPIAWGPDGVKQWAKLPASTPPLNNTVAGLAATFKNGSTIVYDNNGIEDGTYGSFYNNQGSTTADSAKPGFANLFSMSNYFPLVFATYVRINQPTTITELNGYFDANNVPALPFDPQNPYLKYRVNLWSGTSTMPADTGNFTGNVLSSDTRPGTVTISNTGVTRISNQPLNTPDPIWRVKFTLATPITLQPGDYWFSHDAAIRENAFTSSDEYTLTTSELSEVIRTQPLSNSRGKARKVSFFGREMNYSDSWELPIAVQVKPSAAVTTNE